ncbi:winged helix-turn-helix domain-containing protein [Halobaculum limi]|uniref:winged helix-turn-helix domain-containing protein n=1 Tax=Halobaculum limi TaxID=3031916 RepID=UPI002405593C|nr:winged helix-turn-helix domain-containing protein [Halobaculum sp. YSMS11]
MNRGDSDADASSGTLDPTAEGFDPAAAFALLGDETRLRILRELWEAQRESDDLGGSGVPFEALRDRAEVSDSGRFNYHLGKLTDRFIERTEAGYRLRFAGNRVVGALLEGTYAPGEELEQPVEGTCWRCDGALVLHYADERVHVTCEECGVDTIDFGCPPGVLAGRDPAKIPAVVDAHLRTLLARARRGICPTCSGPTTATVASAETAPNRRDDDAEDAEADDAPVVTLRCERCGERIRAGLPTLVFDRPAVVAFLHDRGVDPEAELLWVALDDLDPEVETQADPYRASVTFATAGDTLTVTVDADGEVVDVTTGHPEN